MTQALSRLSNKLTAFFSMMLRLAKHQADQKTLTHHIVEINKKQSSTEIISEVSRCMKELLNYRLFAFVVKKERTVDVWLDPRMYKNSIESIIQKDFHISNKNAITYLNHTFHPDEHEAFYDLDDLIYYEINEQNCFCRIYMLPDNSIKYQDEEAITLILQSCSSALSRQLKIESLKNAAVIDPLTGCYNRREFENQLRRTISSAVRHNNPLSIFMLDLDHFKKINDTHGHLAGDKVLKEISHLVKRNMRSGDVLTRYGGEEFIAILPETDRTKAIELADRLRSKIANWPIVYENTMINVTASFGVSQLEPNTDLTKIINDADTMLYKAKLNGRNTVMPGVMKIIEQKVENIQSKQMV